MTTVPYCQGQHQLTSHGEVEIMPTLSPLQCVLMSGTWRLLEDKCEYQSSHKLFKLQSILPEIYVQAMVAQNLWKQANNV